MNKHFLMEKALCGKILDEKYFAVLLNSSLRAPVPSQLVSVVSIQLFL